MGHVAHRWPTEKATSGPSECQERLGKTVFPTQYRKNRPRNDKGHKGGRHARLRGRGRHSRQPWTLRPLTRPPGPPLAFGSGPLTAGGTGRPGYRRSCRSHPCPRYARVPIARTPCGVLPRGLRPRLPHVRIERKSGARLPPDHLLGGHGKPARPSAWADAHATGAPIKYIGKKSGESIPTLRVARTPAQAGARATGAPIQVHRGKSDMDAAGWLPTAEGA